MIGGNPFNDNLLPPFAVRTLFHLGQNICSWVLLLQTWRRTQSSRPT